MCFSVQSTLHCLGSELRTAFVLSQFLFPNYFLLLYFISPSLSYCLSLLASHREKMASPKQPRGWGQNIKDFKMKINSHGYKQTRQQSKGPSQRIRPARRKISKELDYFHGFVRRTFRYDDFEAEISDDQAIPTSSTNRDFPDDSDIVISEDDEDTGDFNERANPDWNGDEFQGINLTLTEDVVDKYTMFFAEVGDAPTLGACEYF
jgi:hypothetical protein